MNTTLIIPILNESQQLPKLAYQLEKLSPQPTQVVLVDGGSSDDSVNEARSLGLTVISSERGRAIQQNTGAKYALEQIRQQAVTTKTMGVLVFLHADTKLPTNAMAVIQQHYQHRVMQTSMIQYNANNQHHGFWGRFDVQIDSQHWLLTVVSFMINVRSRLSKVATGDQAIFVEARLFEQVNGFVDIPLMEDVELCKRLRKMYYPICLKDKVVTSARRWHKYGLLQTIVLMWQLRFDYWRGVSPDTLAIKYGYVPRQLAKKKDEDKP